MEKSDVLAVLSPDNCEMHEELSPDNCEMHEELSQLPLKSGKRAYIDKGFTPKEVKTE